ncbi:hypothetical protein XspCFBP7912_04645 [Xanthomonas sp. CFBP 7912]|nr:hypothetical protein XspCFBP7912_04645 [Xanthomonas sp. CFBP 7912]
MDTGVRIPVGTPIIQKPRQCRGFFYLTIDVPRAAGSSLASMFEDLAPVCILHSCLPAVCTRMHIPTSTDEYRRVPTSTDEYRRVPTSTDEYRRSFVRHG